MSTRSVAAHEAEQRVTLAEMKAINDGAAREHRDLTDDEQRRFDALEDSFDAIAKALRDEQRAEQRGEGGDGPPAWVREGEILPETAASTRPGIALAPEQRMSSWCASRFPQHEFSQTEARNFSLGRAVRGFATGDWSDAEIEQRALAEGSGGSGGFLVPTPIAGYVIDRLRNQARVLEAGATVVPMESATLSVPRLASDAVPAWKAENAAVAQSDPVFERVQLSAKTLAVGTPISIELYEDMPASSTDFITSAIEKALAVQLDYAALRGDGTANSPTGVRFQSGVTLQSLGTNGATPTDYAPLLNADYALEQANVEANAAILNPRTEKTFAGYKDTTGQPLRKPDQIADLQLLTTNQVPVNLTQGTATTASEIYTADWSKLLIGVRPQMGVRVVVDHYSGLPNLQVKVWAWLRADVQVAHPEAFIVTTGVLP